MPSRSARARAAIRPSLACLSIVFLVPVCATLFMGGADWTISESFRLSWYGETIVWPLLAALVGWICVAGSARAEAPAEANTTESPRAEVASVRAHRFAEGFASVGLSLAGLAIGILWSGGFRFPFLSLGSPALSALGAIACFGISVFAGARTRHTDRRHRCAQAPRYAGAGATSFPSRWIALASALGALGLGFLLHLSLVELDARSLTRAMEKGGAGDMNSANLNARPDVLWIVVDTLRADALGVYGRVGNRGEGARSAVSRTPFMDSLANRGVLFERALAPAPWTVPSMFSMFTSLWPSSLDPEGRGRARSAEERIGLDGGVPTWVDVMRENGYAAAGFQKNPFLGEGSGLETRFDLYREVGGDRAEAESAAQLVNAALRWGKAMREVRDRVEGGRNNGAAPFLLYLHFMDPHIDYAPPLAWLPDEAEGSAKTIDGRARTLHMRLEKGPAITEEERVALFGLYLAEVAYLDTQLARLWTGLEERSLVNSDTLVIVTGDHGEQFGEHGGWEHGDLFTENLHVPLVMAGAGTRSPEVPRRVSAAVSLLDLGPTVLALSGLGSMDEIEGRGLFLDRALEGPASERFVFSEYGARARVELGRWSWVEGRASGGMRNGALYDQREDPGETRDQSMLRPEIANRLRDALVAHRNRNQQGVELERVLPLPGDRQRQLELEALGYGRSSE